MTAQSFRSYFWGPDNKPNRDYVLTRHKIFSFAGLPLKRMGWTGFVNALGDHYKLDVRNFSCEARFIDALAAKLEDRFIVRKL